MVKIYSNVDIIDFFVVLERVILKDKVLGEGVFNEYIDYSDYERLQRLQRLQNDYRTITTITERLQRLQRLHDDYKRLHIDYAAVTQRLHWFGSH